MNSLLHTTDNLNFWEKRPRHPKKRRLIGLQSRQSGHCGEEKNLFLLQGIKPHFLSHPTYSLDFMPAELHFNQNEYFMCVYVLCQQFSTFSDTRD
jgi:hypothetical protein